MSVDLVLVEPPPADGEQRYARWRHQPRWGNQYGRGVVDGDDQRHGRPQRTATTVPGQLGLFG